MLTSIWGNGLAPVIAAPTAAQTAAATTPTAFAGWPAAVQASFIRANGRGSPPSVVVGASGDQALAQLGADGATVTTTPLPTDFNTTPSQVTLAQFSAWDDPIQALYVTTYGAGSPPSLSLGGLVIDGAFTATLSADGSYATTAGSAAMQAANAQTLGLAPEKMTSAAFFALPADEQATYVAKYSRGTSLLAIGGASLFGNPVIPVGSGQPPLSVVVPEQDYQGFSRALTDGISYVTGFASWPEPVRTAYLANALYNSPGTGRVVYFPKASPGPAFTATLGENGTGVSIRTMSAGFNLQAQGLDLDTFLSWTAAEQTIFVANSPPPGVITLRNAAGQSATLSLSGGTVTVTPADAATNAAPASMDPALFGFLTPDQQLAYFTDKAAGQPLSVTFGTGASRVLLTQNGAGQLGLEAYPSGFDTPSASLDPSTFLKWDANFRLLYAAANSTGTPPSLVLGTGAGAVAVSMPTVNGATMTAFSPIPYYTMPGASSGVTSPINDLTAATVFPILDGSGGLHDVTPLPTDFGEAPSALTGTEFTGWNSAVQLQYLRQHQTPGLPLSIGTSPDEVDAFMQTTAASGAIPKVYVIQNLQKGDIATMSFADQKTLAGSLAFSGVNPPASASLAQGLGLIPDYQGTTPPTGATAPPIAEQSGPIGGDTPDPKAGLTMAADLSKVTLSAFGYVQQMFTAALNTMTYPDQTKPTLLAGATGTMPAGDLKVFTDEVNLLRQQTFGSSSPTLTSATQTSGQAIFSPKDIQDKLTAIITRFKRAYAFASSGSQANGYYELTSIKTDEEGDDSPAGEKTYTTDLSSYISYWNDKGASFSPTYPSGYQGPTVPITYSKGQVETTRTTLIALGPLTYTKTMDVEQLIFTWHDYPTRPDASATAQGYTTFMAQEKTILDLANRVNQLAGTGTLTDPQSGRQQQLDVPNLVYLFQLYANLTGEAVLRADTEEVNQTNELLNEYAVMQKIINQTVAQIPPQNDSKDTPTTNLKGSNPDGSFTTAEQAIVAMFNNQYITAGGATGTPPSNPIELLNGITRPLNNLSSGNSLSAQAWSSIGTSLSDAVTQINQASQLKMNDINADTKQKDRHFDLANTALQKAADTVSKIASAA